MTKKTTDAVVNASKKPTKSKRPTARPEPFAHAKDLADAYQELKAAILATMDTGRGLDEFHLQVLTGLSMCSLWRDADAKVEAWQRLGAAARRVHVAIHGKKDAVHWDGFMRRKAA